MWLCPSIFWEAPPLRPRALSLSCAISSALLFGSVTATSHGTVSGPTDPRNATVWLPWGVRYRGSTTMFSSGTDRASASSLRTVSVRWVSVAR